MIQGVFFDMGGVLLRTEDLSPRRKWEARFGLPEWGLADAVFNSEPSRRASVGRAGEDGIWEHVARRFGLTEAEAAELQHDFWAGDRLDEPLVAYIGSLRPRYRTGLISNAWPSMREFVGQNDLVRAAFEKVYLSAEIGIAKPDRRIYQLALDELGLVPGEAVFVDDQSENVEAAQALGVAGLLYRPGMDVPAQLAGLGVQL
jgi:HAD superfamily hydrolase (TIGR01509 family)